MANASEQKADEGLLPCTFQFHNFITKVSDTTFNCQIIKMENCLYLWIGDCNKTNMDDLSFAFPSDFEKQPIVTKIVGAEVDTTSANMAKRLSMKLGKPVYVSFNVTVDHILLLGIEKRIQEEFKTHPDLMSF